jgi:hypothetical protein
MSGKYDGATSLDLALVILRTPIGTRKLLGRLLQRKHVATPPKK